MLHPQRRRASADAPERNRQTAHAARAVRSALKKRSRRNPGGQALQSGRAQSLPQTRISRTAFAPELLWSGRRCHCDGTQARLNLARPIQMLFCNLAEARGYKLTTIVQ